MASCLDSFSSWLSIKLQELNIDENVFGNYIQGILDNEEDLDDKYNTLEEFLTEIMPEYKDMDKVCKDIVEQWQYHNNKKSEPIKELNSEDVDTKLVKLLESQSLTTTKQKSYTEEEKKIREAILSQYSQMTDDENDEDQGAVGGGGSGSGAGGGDHKENGLEKNLNAQSVIHAEKVKREQAKLDSQRKKEKDKEDREKQKQLREEKKEKRKTQKGERRR